MKPNKINAEIHNAAAAWVARVDRGGLSPEESVRLEAWLAEDRRHMGAYVRAQAAWKLAGQPQTAAAAVVPRRKYNTTRRHALVWGTSAAAAALVAAFFGVRHWMAPQYGTEIGEVSQKSLPDGSVIALDTASAVSAHFESSLRAVHLDHGRALFDVAKDANRPFVVAAGPIRVRAVGTAFSVRRFDDGAEIIVTEGTVAVWNAAAPEKKIFVTAGQAARVANAEAVLPQPQAMTVEEINHKTAWRSGQIILSGETLRAAAAEFNRYNKEKIVIADAGLAEKTLVGGFRATDPHGFSAVVSALLHAKIHADGETITLSR